MRDLKFLGIAEKLFPQIEEFFLTLFEKETLDDTTRADKYKLVVLLGGHITVNLLEGSQNIEALENIKNFLESLITQSYEKTYKRLKSNLDKDKESNES